VKWGVTSTTKKDEDGRGREKKGERERGSRREERELDEVI
jgi:hypothetical protein